MDAYLNSWYYHYSYFKVRVRDKWENLIKLKAICEEKWWNVIKILRQTRIYKKIRARTSKVTDNQRVYFYTLLSCFFFALCSLFTDLIGKMPITEILWWRFFFTLIFTTFVTVYNDYPSPLSYRNYKMILLTAVLGTLTAMSTVFALRHLPIGEATLLLTTAPIFTVILSRVFLKEKLAIWDVGALVLATIGVFFVAQPSFIFGSEKNLSKSPVFYISIVVALGRGFFKAAKYVAVSCAGVDVPTAVIVMSLSCLGFLVSTVFLIISVSVELLTDKDMSKTWIHPGLLNFTFLFMVGVTYCLQQVCVCKAMQYGNPGKTSLLKYLDVVLPFVFQFLIFKEFPNKWSIIGSTCIAISTVTVLFVKRVQPIRHVTFKDEVEEAVEEAPPPVALVTMEMENVEVAENEVVLPKGTLQFGSDGTNDNDNNIQRKPF